MPKKYYAMIDGEQKGPFLLEELPAAGVRPSTYIWTKGLPDWQKAEDNADVCRLFRNHLYDMMHPADQGVDLSPEELEKYKIQPDSPSQTQPRSNFDRFLGENDEPIPTLEEIDARKDTSVPPVSMVLTAWLVTLFCCWPTGIAAIIYAYKSRNAWKKGQNELAYEYNRSAKMWTGISFFLGIIGYAFLFAFTWQ